MFKTASTDDGESILANIFDACFRALFEKREIKQSLSTGNHREALRKARKLAAFYQDRFEQMGKYDDYANDPTLARIRVSIVKFPDGRVEFQNLEMDPDKPEAEALLLKAIADNIGQLPTATRSQNDAQRLLLSLDELTGDLFYQAACPRSSIQWTK